MTGTGHNQSSMVSNDQHMSFEQIVMALAHSPDNTCLLSCGCRSAAKIGACHWRRHVVVQCLLHMPQIEFALSIAESAATVRNLGKSWGMCGKYRNISSPPSPLLSLYATASALVLLLQETDNPDLRDRAYIYWRLLSTDPDAAKEVVLAEKPVIMDNTTSLEPSLLTLLLGQLGNLASVYHKPPEAFVTRSRMAVQRAEDLAPASFEEEGPVGAGASEAMPGAHPHPSYLLPQLWATATLSLPGGCRAGGGKGNRVGNMGRGSSGTAIQTAEQLWPEFLTPRLRHPSSPGPGTACQEPGDCIMQGREGVL